MHDIMPNGQPRNTTPHASAAYSDWAALRARIRSPAHVSINGRDLTVADVVAVSL